MANKGNTNAVGNTGGRSFQDRELASKVRIQALNDIYDALPDHADTIAEAYQGASEKLLTYGEVSLPTIRTKDEAVSYLRSLYGKINNLQSMMPYSEIVNELDNVKSSINSAKYKLIFLQ